MRKPMRLTRATFAVLIKRFPYIVGYSILLYALFALGQSVYYKIMPAEHFLSYTSVIAQDGEAHEPVNFTVCREKRDEYRDVSGTRIIYKVPQKDSKQNAQRVYEGQFRGEITKPACVPLQIEPETFDHTQGFYYFYTKLCFKPNNINEKCSEFETNVYEITEPLQTNEQIERKIQELEKEIQKLKLLLASNYQSSERSNRRAETNSSSSSPQSGSRTASVSNSPKSSTSNPDNPNPPSGENPQQQGLVPNLLDATDEILQPVPDIIQL